VRARLHPVVAVAFAAIAVLVACTKPSDRPPDNVCDGLDASCAVVPPQGGGGPNPDGGCGLSCDAGCVGDECGVAGDGAATCGGFGSRVPACDACFRLSCCAQGATCSANPSCAAIQICVTSTCAPNDFTCQQSCVQSNPNGAQDYQSLSTCMTSNCFQQCNPPVDAAAE
jgi:hypothetical protein